MVSLYIFEGDCWTEVCLPPIHPGLDDGNRVRVSFLVCLSANHRAWQVTRGHGILLFFEGKEGGGLRARDVSCCDCNGHCSESDLVKTLSEEAMNRQAGLGWWKGLESKASVVLWGRTKREDGGERWPLGAYRR